MIIRLILFVLMGVMIASFTPVQDSASQDIPIEEVLKQREAPTVTNDVEYNFAPGWAYAIIAVLGAFMFGKFYEAHTYKNKFIMPRYTGKYNKIILLKGIVYINQYAYYAAHKRFFHPDEWDEKDYKLFNSNTDLKSYIEDKNKKIKAELEKSLKALENEAT